MTKQLALSLGCAAALLSTLGARAMAVDFYPIASIESSTAATDLFPVINLIQGPGDGFDLSEPHDAVPATASTLWVTDAPGGFPADYIAVAGMPVLTIDLGEDVPLNEIDAWGYNPTNANGISQYSLKFATQDDGPGSFGASIAYNPTFELINDNVARQVGIFDRTVVARYVQLTAEDNFYIFPGDSTDGHTPGGDRVGLGEIAFPVAPIPEPSTLVLGSVGLSLVAVASLRRRRR